MVIEIGIVAGEIIDLLERTQRPMRMLELEILIDHPVTIVDMALGWLIREHHVKVVRLAGEKFILLPEVRPTREEEYCEQAGFSK